MAEGVAITARRLRRLEAWSDWQANGGTRQSVVDDAIAARASITLENEQLSITLPLDSPAITALGARKIIRIDQDDSRTNYQLQSENIAPATAWGLASVTTTLNAAIAPDGTLTADKIQEDNTNNVHTAYQYIGVGIVPDNAIVTFSHHLKAAERTWALVSITDKAAAGHPMWVNLATGAIATHSSTLNAEVVAAPNGYWRCAVTANVGTGVNQVRGLTYSTTGDGVSGFVGTTGSGIYAWGAQFEIAPRMTAYIPTTTTAVTIDAIFDEYRILERAVDDQQGVWAITAAPLRLTDLGGSGLISRKDSDGVVVYDFEVLGLTPTEVITNWVLPSLAATGFGWISIGTVTPTARLDMTFAWDTPLSVLLRLASATTCELDLRKSGAGYVIDLVSKINIAAQRADLRIDKNLVNVTRSESSIDQATRVFPKGAAGDSMAATMARATWQVSAISGVDLTLADPAGGVGPIQFDGQLAGRDTVSSSGIVGRWPFDGDATDASGGGLDLTLSGAPSFVPGTIGQALSLNGTTQYASKPSMPAGPTLGITLRAIINGASLSSLRTIASWNGQQVPLGYHWFYVNAGQLGFQFTDGAALHTVNTTGANLTAGTTYDVGVVHDYAAKTITFYVNGAVYSTHSVSAFGAPVPIIAAKPFFVGLSSDGTGFFSGTIDDARVYGRPLSAAEMLALLSVPAQLTNAYLRKVDGSLVKVIGSSAPNIVRVASATGIAVSDVIQFRASSAGDDLTSLDAPACVGAYGIKAAVRDVSDVPATNNLVKNPAMRAWPGSSSAPPTNWTAVGAPTIAKQTAAPFTAIGGNSIKVTGTADAQGVISDAVTIFPTATNPYLSGYAKVWVASGNARVELVITTPSGTKVFPLLPDLATPTSLGQWFDVGAAGFDAFAVSATAAQIRIVQNGTTGSVFYIDAAQITATSSQEPWFEGSGATRLWQEANDALRTGSNPVVSFTVPLVDLEAYDPVTWSESALIIGANARIVDPRLGIDIITRIVGIERDYIQPENIAVTLSTRFDDLTDILASSARPTRDSGSSAAPATIPQQPKLTITFDINGQAIINSIGDNDVVSQKIAMGTSAPSAATVRAATAINQQNLSNYATGTTFAQGTVVFVGAFAYDAAGLESSPLLIVSGARQGAIIDYTPFASTLAPVAILASLPGTGAFVGQIVFLTTDKKLYRWDGATWSTAVAAVDITGTINTAQIAAGAITATQLGAAAVTAGKIAASAVGSTEIASLAITNAKIAANAVDTGKLAASAVTTTELAALAVTGAKIAALTITAGNIAAHTISANEIAALTITAAEISAGAITAAKIAAGAITAGKISVGTGGAALNSDPNTTDLTAWDFAGGLAVGLIATVTDGKVGSTTLRSNPESYYVSHKQPYDPAKSYRVRAWARRNATANGVLYLGMGVYNNAGAFADITNNFFYVAAAGVTASATWTEYQGVLPANRSWNTTPETMVLVALINYTGTVGYIELQDFRLEEVLPGTLIMDGSIITNKLAANAVTAGKIAADTITASEIAAGAITSSELAAGSVIAGKIAALTIVAGDIAAATITGAKIAANTISASNIVANTITAGQIQAGAISATEIAAGAITTSKIAAGAVTANEISAGTITADRIVAGSITTTQLAPITVTCSLRDTTTPTRGSAVQAGLTWDTEDFDAFGLHTTNGTAITTDSAGGLVIIHAVIRWPSSNLLGIRELRLFKNSTQLPEVRQDTRSTFNAGQLWQEYTWYDASVSGGDFWEVIPYQDSGSTIAVEGKRFTFIHARI